MPEAVVYINDKWHTGQLRNMSSDLASALYEVTETFGPDIKKINPEMDGDDATDMLRRELFLARLPQPRRDRWENAELDVAKYLVSLPNHFTPARVDRNIESAMVRINSFDSGAEALKYIELTDKRLRALLQASLRIGFGNPVAIAASAYVESRVMRFATQGDYFVAHGTLV